MKKTQHLFENGIYLISNHSVASNELFASIEMQEFFVSRVQKHLQPICKILGYCLNDNEFQLLVRLKERESFKKAFLSRVKNRELALDQIPDSTYIFSQAMSNLQVSFVKFYNHVNRRSGGLMAGRFYRKLVESPEEMKMWIERLNNGFRLHTYVDRWMVKLKEPFRVKTSAWLYKGEKGPRLNADSLYENGHQINLGGYFQNLPPYELADKSRYFKYRFNQLFGPNPGPYF